jgi:hypothetical protein
MMPVKRPFRVYLRSRLNLWISAAAAALIIIAGLTLGPWALGGALIAVAAYAVVTLLLFFSRRGAETIVGEGEQARKKKIAEKIAAYTGLRDRVSFLRVGDPDMLKAVEYFLLVSGSYLEKCRELGLYSPQANKRMDDVLEICQAYLGELDEDSSDRRYGVQDGESIEEFKRRTLEGITEASADIKKCQTEELEGVSRQDRLAIIEELEGKQGEGDR